MKPLINKKVSIVVPVYNTGRDMLVQCFDSILMQNYEPLELIIVNDGSTNPDTNEICYIYAEKNRDRCILVEKRNEGVSVARGNGIMEASGADIMFVDSDDYLEEGAVARLMEVKAEYGADTVIGEDYIRSGIKPVQVYSGKELLTALLENKEASFGWALWGKLFDTDLMRYYYKPRKDIYYGEDLIANAEYFANAQKTVVINEKIYNYRTDNPDSAMKQSVSIKKLSLIKMWKQMEDIYVRHGYEAEALKIKANYYDSLLSGYLQCEYYRYDNYKDIMRQIKSALKDNMGDILKNPYVNGKMKYPAAVYCLWLFKLKKALKRVG